SSPFFPIPRPPPPTSTLFPYTTLFRSQRPRTLHWDFANVRRHDYASRSSRPPLGSSASMGTSPPGSTISLTFSRSASLPFSGIRSEEHTSELQSRSDLVCRLLLEKKNK